MSAGAAAGRGGFYGSLHPAYQPFGIPSEGSTPASCLTGPPAVPIPTAGSDAGKLDEILSLLHSQQHEITTLASEIKEIKQQIKGAKSGRVRVPKDLSRLAHSIHESYLEGRQFDRTKLYLDKHNVEVSSSMIMEIQQSGNTHSLAEVKQAVYRVFDGLRRSFTDEKPNRQAQVAQNRKKTTTRSMQNQLYARRKKYLKGQEKKYWDDIDPSFMSEESTHECEGECIVHKHAPIFRSEGLNKLIKKLDGRHAKHLAKKKTPSFKQYRRVVCSPSKAKPKKNSPAWATSNGAEDLEPCDSDPPTSTANSSMLSSLNSSRELSIESSSSSDSE